MKFAENVVIAVGTSEDGPGAHSYKLLKQMEFLNRSTIHFVHVCKTVNYSTVLGRTLTYPVADERASLEESIFQYLKSTFSPVLPERFSGQAHFKCLFSEEPKKAMIKYAQEADADLIIVASRKEHGIFESSFAQYMYKHTMADVLILKIREEALIGR